MILFYSGAFYFFITIAAFISIEIEDMLFFSFKVKYLDRSTSFTVLILLVRHEVDLFSIQVLNHLYALFENQNKKYEIPCLLNKYFDDTMEMYSG